MMIGLFGLGLILIIGIVIFFSRSAAPEKTWDERQKKTALDILEQRLAKGEIDVIEFEEKKRIIINDEEK